ncbi:hypothetical protein V6D52_09945 [Idiomarina loihiensis]
MRTWIYTVFTVFLFGLTASASADDPCPEIRRSLEWLFLPF